MFDLQITLAALMSLCCDIRFGDLFTPHVVCPLLKRNPRLSCLIYVSIHCFRLTICWVRHLPVESFQSPIAKRTQRAQGGWGCQSLVSVAETNPESWPGAYLQSSSPIGPENSLELQPLPSSCIQLELVTDFKPSANDLHVSRIASRLAPLDMMDGAPHWVHSDPEIPRQDGAWDHKLDQIGLFRF